MTQYPKPIVLISECLGVKPVRHDGNIICDDFIETLKKYIEIRPICPEVEIGLGVPRNPLVLYEEKGVIDLVDTVSGDTYAGKIRELVDKITSNLQVDGIILKSMSPSCGVGDAKVYGPGRRVLRKADGLFTMLIKNTHPCIPLESEKRLYNYEIRSRFLTKIFAIADLRSTLRDIKSREDLVEFHKRNKYIIMLHSDSSLKNLGRVVAARKSIGMEELVKKYSDEFMKAMCMNPHRGSYTNVLTHIYGHLKNELPRSERKYILDLIEKYRRGLENLRTILVYFRGFKHRLEDKYLAESRFFQPYPDELDIIP
ncbi:MAG: DUF523 and DUF1722 domain-containing protein [Desulfurococcaceae archaeon]